MRNVKGMRAQPEWLLTCIGFLALVRPSAAWWPFGESDAEPEEDGGELVLEPDLAGPIIFGPNGPMVLQGGQFGFDPWEDLHNNLKDNLEKALKDSQGRRGGGGLLFGPPGGDEHDEQGVLAPVGLQAQLSNIMQVFGDDHMGHFGRAEGGFRVDDDHLGLRISASLPGYKLGGIDLGSSPLAVKVVGKRSLVVTGTLQDGPFVEQWQRSFMLPKGSDTDAVTVTYNGTDGNLTVVVPRRADAGNSSDTDDDMDMQEEQFDDDMEPFLPPALRAMQEGLPEIFSQMQAAQQRGGSRGHLRGGGGFLVPMDGPPMFGEVFDLMDSMHPRFQPPPEGEREVPDEVEVNLIGCFAEEQLAKADLKYYGETNAASFAAMYWHAQADRVPYFAMSRHEVPLGHAFTFRNFAHDQEVPRWGTYDGCGSRCEDDETRWCGCANEASRGVANPECGEQEEKRFAVYKAAAAAAPEVALNETATISQEAQLEQSASAGATGPERRSEVRPYWQLSSSSADEGPTLEIVAPKGTVAKAAGRQVVLYNASVDNEGPSESSEGTAEEKPNDTVPQEAESSAVIGKFRLPVDVDPEQCSMEEDRSDTGKVLKCRLEQNDVKELPIKVLDEL